jgi:hypothetical protein
MRGHAEALKDVIRSFDVMVLHIMLVVTYRQDLQGLLNLCIRAICHVGTQICCFHGTRPTTGYDKESKLGEAASQVHDATVLLARPAQFVASHDTHWCFVL